MPRNRLAYVWSVEKYVRHAVSVVNIQGMGFLGDLGKLPASTGHNSLIPAQPHDDKETINRPYPAGMGDFRPIFPRTTYRVASPTRGSVQLPGFFLRELLP